MMPGTVYEMHLWGYVHNNDKRWAPLTLEEIKATDLETVKAFLTPDLTNGPMEIIIVGDIDVDTTLAQLARTFGALGKRKFDTKPFATHEEMPKGGAAPLVVHHKGATQEAVAMLAWKTTGMFPDTQTPRILRVLEAAMRTRLFDELRTKEGITYSPQTASVNSWGTPGWGLLSVAAGVPATKLADFYAAAKKVAADLAAKELSPEEFERARGPLVSDTEHAAQNNTYWLHALAGIEVEPRALELVRARVSGLKAVTAADVQKVAQTFLKDDRTFRLIVVPDGVVVPDNLP
jgi:zinc protease